MASILPDDGEWLSPVALAREEPVAEFVVHGAASEGLFLKQSDDPLLGLGCWQPVEKSGVHSHSLTCKAGGEHGRPAREDGDILQPGLCRIFTNVFNQPSEVALASNDPVIILLLPDGTFLSDGLVDFMS